MTADAEPILLDELADWLGATCAIGRALFELTGAWSAEADVAPADRVRLAVVSRRLGDHSEMWRNLLPDSPALDAGARIVVPDPWAAALVELATIGRGDRAPAIDEVVLPALSSRNDGLAPRLRATSDAPVQRTLRSVDADLADIGVGAAKAPDEPMSPEALDRVAVVLGHEAQTGPGVMESPPS